MQKHMPSRFAKWSLIIGIVIVLNLFFNYAISLVYTAPVYPEAPQVVNTITTQEDCIAVGGRWTENTAPNVPTPVPPPEGPKNETFAPVRTGYCDTEYTKRNQYDEARKVYEKNVFIVLVILGIVALIIGVVSGQEILSIALSWGGVLSLIIASMRYWTAAGNGLKVGILAIALIALIWTALRRFSPRS